MREKKSIQTINTDGENLYLSWNPSGELIAVGDTENNISFIDFKKFKIEKRVKCEFQVNQTCWDPSGELFFMTISKGGLDVYKIENTENNFSVNEIATLYGKKFYFNYTFFNFN